MITSSRNNTHVQFLGISVYIANIVYPMYNDRGIYIFSYRRIISRGRTDMMLGMNAYFVIATLLLCTCLGLLADRKCAFEFTKLTCNNIVPVRVPPEVTDVYISIDRHSFTFEAIMFADVSWKTVRLLDITAQYNNNKGNFKMLFASGRFKLLSKLKELRFHGDRIRLFNANVFANNGHLSLLEFSSCPLMKFEYFLNTLSIVNITIENLTLIHMASSSSDYYKINDRSMQMLSKCRVVNLSLSDSIVFVQHISHLPKRFYSLRSLNLSNVYFIYLDSSMSFSRIYKTYDGLLGGLISLDVSRYPMERFSMTANIMKDRIITQCNHPNVKFFLEVENVYADEIFRSKSVVIDNIFLNVSMRLVKLKTLHFRQNRLKYINMTLYLPKQNNISKVDLSFNELTYISPYAFRTARSLLTLNLNSNKLGQMETLPEFHELLRDFAILKYFSIAGNGISKLPFDFFVNNSYLQVLDLSHNAFETIIFNLTNLHYLLVLNLSFNRIHFLEGKALHYVQFYLNTNDGYQVILDFSGNPIEFSCKSVDFIEWIISDLHPHLTHKYTCEMEGDTSEINEHSLQYSNYLCYRTAVIVGVTVFAVGVLSGLVLLMKCVSLRKRKRRQMCAQKLLLNDFVKGKMQKQYICQISFASEDEMCILNVIHPNLKRVLNKRIEIDRDVICIGDLDFNLGRPIVNEILRCISESCLMVCVISKYFCESQWCEMELREAYESKIPIILILKEEVQENKMPPLLLTIFNRFTRAKLKTNGGEYELIPDWKSLCESIINLASNSYIEKLAEHERRNNNKAEDNIDV